MRFTRFFLLLVLMLPGVILSAQSRKKLEAERMKIIEEIEATSKTLEKTKKNKSATLKDLNALEIQIENRKKLINTISSELEEVDHTIAFNNAQIDSLKSNLADLKVTYKKLMRADYLRRTSTSRWVYIFSANGINDAFLRWKYNKQYEQYCLQKSDQIKSITKRMTASNEVLKQEAEDQKALLQEEESQSKTLASELEDKDKILKKLEANEKVLRSDLKKHKKERESLNKEIESVILAGLKAAKKDSKSVEEESTKSSSFANSRGSIPWPVKTGYVSKSFGSQKHPTLKGITINNNGIDITTKSGANTYAVYEGKVVGVTVVPGYNYMVIVQHGNYYTVYSRMSTVKVKKGDAIKQGSIIGALAADETEIHFELWKDKTKLNPQKWIDKK